MKQLIDSVVVTLYFDDGTAHDTIVPAPLGKNVETFSVGAEVIRRTTRRQINKARVDHFIESTSYEIEDC